MLNPIRINTGKIAKVSYCLCPFRLNSNGWSAFVIFKFVYVHKNCIFSGVFGPIWWLLVTALFLNSRAQLAFGTLFLLPRKLVVRFRSWNEIMKDGKKGKRERKQNRLGDWKGKVCLQLHDTFFGRKKNEKKAWAN